MLASSWAAEELRNADFGDVRLNTRLCTLVETLAAQPEASFPQACGTWAATKAAYRFISSEAVTPQAIRAAQHQAVIERARRESAVLVVQDSTQLDFSTQPQMQGLGPLRAPSHLGVHVHSGFVVSTRGLPLGVLWQEVWARDAAQLGQSHQRKQRKPEDKESQKWLAGLQATSLALPNTVHYIMVGDREADFYPLLAQPRADNSDYVIRACYDRCIGEEAHKLYAALAQSAPLGEMTVDVARRKGELPRQATVQVRATSVTLQPSAYTKAYGPVQVQAVLAEETAPPEGVTPLHWVLLSSLPVEDFVQACTVLRYYTYRWLIERYHFVLKSGCRLERLQLETAVRLQVALALYSVVAWRLLWLCYQGRLQPEVSCVAYLQLYEWQALYCTIHNTPHPPASPPTLRQAVRWIAQLGGFLGRKGDGEPGVQTLWRGMQRLHDIAATWKLLPPPETYG